MRVPRSGLEEAYLLPALSKLGVTFVTGVYTLVSLIGEPLTLLILLSSLLTLVLACAVAVAPQPTPLAVVATSLLLGAIAFGLVSSNPHAPLDDTEDGICPRTSPFVPPVSARLSRFDMYPTPDGFVDGLNRSILLRGVNLGGSSKIPTQDVGTHATRDRSEFYHGKVSYIGRPLELVQADEHLARLASWGFTCVRLLITWEAVEPETPGAYDEEYLNYLLTLVRKAADHGLAVYVDPHQDVWSRFTGGDGAPRWTLDKVGFKVGPNLHTSGAAFIHGELGGEDMPRMTWPTNYGKLATSTMFTLFFAGNTYAPATKIEGIPVQDYLQNAYVAMLSRVAEVLSNEANVLGFDSMNEPSTGYVGQADLRTSVLAAPMGTFCSGFDGMLMGAGFSRDLPVFSLPMIYNGTVEWNKEGETAWKSAESDVWRANGVWTIDEETKLPVLLRPDHFATRPGEEDFVETYMVPFYLKLRRALDRHSKALVVFAEPHIDLSTGKHGELSRSSLKRLHELSDRWGWAPHFYDGLSLVTKTYRPWFGLDLHPEASFVPPIAVGRWMIDRAFKKAGKHMDAVDIPAIVGETGIPMDLNAKRAYETGNFEDQIACLDRTLRAFELLSTTLWNYCAENDNERGDQWNGEDLSLWSKNQVSDSSNLNSGGRALRAAVRPYAMRASGQLLEALFNPQDRRYVLTIKVSDSGVRETLVFLPKLHYPDGTFAIHVSSGSYKVMEGREQGLIWRHGNDAKIQTLEITRVSKNTEQ